MAALADAVIDGASVASSTLRMATGLVLVLQGGLALVTGAPRAEPALPGRRAALVPVFFPVLLTPGLALLTISGALDRSAPQAVAVAAAALAMVPLVALVRATPVHAKVLDGLGRLTGAVLLLSGLALLMNGVFDI
jgi:small neutral amino acid transporter SnatA (MarC family)